MINQNNKFEKQNFDIQYQFGSTIKELQKSYTPEFKQQLVDLYRTGNYSYLQLEREYLKTADKFHPIFFIGDN